jgi:hypothetical protein
MERPDGLELPPDREGDGDPAGDARPARPEAGGKPANPITGSGDDAGGAGVDGEEERPNPITGSAPGPARPASRSGRRSSGGWCGA